ncbi:putative reverse transcriptase domain-containing protein [Tanacetum coccineum]
MGSSNMAHGGSGNTPIIDKIDNLERQIIDGKLMFVDDDRNSLVSTSYVDSETEVEMVFDETDNLMPLKNSKGHGDLVLKLYDLNIERGFLSPKLKGSGRGVKEKDVGSAGGFGSRLGVDTSPINTGSNQEGFMVTPEPMQSNGNVEVEINAGPTVGQPSTDNIPGKSSYANVTGKPSGTKVNFRTLFTLGGNRIDVVVPVESIRAISERFANTAYGFFLGKRVASMDGLNAMLENGPWFIRNNPLILKKWHPDVNLLKKDVGTVPVWVKLYGVPVTAFGEDGLSATATKLGQAMLGL